MGHHVKSFERILGLVLVLQTAHELSDHAVVARHHFGFTADCPLYNWGKLLRAGYSYAACSRISERTFWYQKRTPIAARWFGQPQPFEELGGEIEPTQCEALVKGP